MSTIDGPSPAASFRASSSQCASSAWLQGQSKVPRPRSAGPASAVGGWPGGVERGCAPCSKIAHPGGSVASPPAPSLTQRQPSAGGPQCPDLAGCEDGGRPGSGTAPASAFRGRRSYSAAAQQRYRLMILLIAAQQQQLHVVCTKSVGISWTTFAFK